MIIKGDLNLRNSSIESLGNLEEVDGDLNLTDSKIISLGKLKIVRGRISCWDCKNLKDLGNLQKV